ncbi:uncharacterized protein LOC121879009 [Homarus americanus]|uniref:Uncharacterized protein n=1 Tax=Homarus americanus TaxID=6706 RepID=A0A8J5JS57_HOMAM|nr:uncharacterized protein LOC121879009 [Homarus americanus]KAG7158199.1 hypothetical protein Hamer_G008834 [Homarus americanus]
MKTLPLSGMIIVYLVILCASPSIHAFFSMSSLSPALERVASYGSYMLGYGSPGPHYGEIDIPYVKEPLWDGHISVGDVVSPLLKALGADGTGSDEHYGDNRVVKGLENRLGFRVAVPYLGDFQVTREIGPGRFLDKLGPGKYTYPGPKDVIYTGGDNGMHYKPPKGHGPPASGSIIPDNTAMYQSLQNYPWYRR